MCADWTQLHTIICLIHILLSRSIVCHISTLMMSHKWCYTMCYPVLPDICQIVWFIVGLYVRNDLCDWMRNWQMSHKREEISKFPSISFAYFYITHFCYHYYSSGSYHCLTYSGVRKFRYPWDNFILYKVHQALTLV